MSISKQSPTCSRGAGLGHPMDPIISVHYKNFSKKLKEACKSSWNPRGNQKSFTLTIPWNLPKLVKIFPGIIVRRHHTDRKQMGLLREQYAEWKKVRLQYCCNRVWMKIGGPIPWNAIPICETFKISLVWRENSTREAFWRTSREDQSFRLVHWLSITLFLRKTSQESINLERKSFLDCSFEYALYAGRIWKGDVLVADIEELETMDAPEIYSKKDPMPKKQYFPKKMENSFFQSQMDEQILLEEIRNWEHPPWYGITQFEEKVKEIFLENQKGLHLHHLKTHFRMPVKR